MTSHTPNPCTGSWALTDHCHPNTECPYCWGIGTTWVLWKRCTPGGSADFKPISKQRPFRKTTRTDTTINRLWTTTRRLHPTWYDRQMAGGPPVLEIRPLHPEQLTLELR